MRRAYQIARSPSPSLSFRFRLLLPSPTGPIHTSRAPPPSASIRHRHRVPFLPGFDPVSGKKYSVLKEERKEERKKSMGRQSSGSMQKLAINPDDTGCFGTIIDTIGGTYTLVYNLFINPALTFFQTVIYSTFTFWIINFVEMLKMLMNGYLLLKGLKATMPQVFI